MQCAIRPRRTPRGFVVGVVGLVACAAAPARAHESAARIFPYPTHVEMLDNGLKVILVPMNAPGLVTYWTIVRTGARDEYEPGHTGFAHFFEHMMFRGSEKYPQDVREEITTRMGADSNAFTSDDLTGYYMSIAAEDLEKAIELEADRFINLKYSESDFKTEAGAVEGEYNKNRSSPFFLLYEAVHDKAFDVHTYGHTAMGFVDDIKAMPTMYAYSKSFFTRYYRPENCVVLVVGDFDRQQTLAWIHHYYDAWERGYTAPQVEPEPEQKAEKRLDVPYEGQSLPLVWMAYKCGAFDPANTTYVAANVLCNLVFGETSPLHKKLVLDEQIVEFFNADVNMNRDPGLIDIIARVKDPAKVEYVIAEIDRVLAEAKQQPADAQRLADLKSRLKYEFLMGLDTPQNVSRALSRPIAVTGGTEAVEALYHAFEHVTADEVRQAAEHYFARERRTLAILRGGES